MKKSDLQFDYPKDLIALEPKRPSRVLINRLDKDPEEGTLKDLFSYFEAGDLLVVNDTKVIPSRVISQSGEEFLFIRELEDDVWQVLFPAKGSKPGKTFELPEGLEVALLEKGLPQKVKLSRKIDFSYFETFGQVNLPPYILSERQGEKFKAEDHQWYQTLWAKHVGSVAAPTASLHFSDSDLDFLKSKGVGVEALTLHVGLGTFLPLKAEELKDHQMHSEYISMSQELLKKARATRSQGKKVWALGTTVARSLESAALGKLQEKEGRFEGESDLFIYPPYEFQLVNALLTNFHQPESTLLALVCAFFEEKKVKEAYAYAITNRFRLFSYGDLSVWIR